MTDGAAWPILEIRSLTVSLPAGGERAHAVSGVSLTVGAGETLCIVGESGFGKSITAQSVMGLLPPGLGGRAGRDPLRGRALAERRCGRHAPVARRPTWR